MGGGTGSSEAKQPDEPFVSPMATQEWVLQAVQVLDGVWEQMANKLEGRMEGMDKVLAEITLGYAKLSSLIEALITTVILNKTDHDVFDNALRESIQKMKDTLDYGQEDAHTEKQRFHPTGPIVDDEPDTSSEPADS